MTGEIPNPYKHAVGRALGTMRPQAHAAATALEAAKKAFAAGAWTGGASGAFGANLQGRDKAVKAATSACVNELETVYRGEPEQVAPTAWQVRWRNQGRVE
jgi:hypothetical protein